MVSAQGCKFGSSFRRRGCGRDAVSECVYCTRPFCEAHGELAEDYAHTCAGKRCRAKLEDLREQTRWRARVAGSNSRNQCAIETCSERMALQCARCRLLFCEGHVRSPNIRHRSLKATIDKIIQGRAILTIAQLPGGRPQAVFPRTAGPTLVCAHCAERRNLWD